MTKKRTPTITLTLTPSEAYSLMGAINTAEEIKATPDPDIDDPEAVAYAKVTTKRLATIKRHVGEAFSKHLATATKGGQRSDRVSPRSGSKRHGSTRATKTIKRD